MRGDRGARQVTRYVSSATAHGAESTPPEPGRFRVLIAGAGPAGVEAALTLQRIAGDRVVTTIVAPEDRFVHLPPAVLSPFAAGDGQRPGLDRVAGAHVRARHHRLRRQRLARSPAQRRRDPRLRRAADRRRRDPAVAIPTRARVRHPGERGTHARTDPGPRGRLHQADRVRRPSGGVVAAADLRTRADDG